MIQYIKKHFAQIVVLLLLFGFATSCANKNIQRRKCDGRKGIRTPMGRM